MGLQLANLCCSCALPLPDCLPVCAQIVLDWRLHVQTNVSPSITHASLTLRSVCWLIHPLPCLCHSHLLYPCFCVSAISSSEPSLSPYPLLPPPHPTSCLPLLPLSPSFLLVPVLSPYLLSFVELCVAKLNPNFPYTCCASGSGYMQAKIKRANCE